MPDCTGHPEAVTLSDRPPCSNQPPSPRGTPRRLRASLGVQGGCARRVAVASRGGFFGKAPKNLRNSLTVLYCSQQKKTGLKGLGGPLRPFGASKVPEGQITFFVGRSEHRRVTLTERIIHTRTIARNAGRIEHRRVTFTGATFTRARSACLSQRYERHVLKDRKSLVAEIFSVPNDFAEPSEQSDDLATQARSRPAPRREDLDRHQVPPPRCRRRLPHRRVRTS